MAMTSMILSGFRTNCSLLWACRKRNKNSMVNQATHTVSTMNMLRHFSEHSPYKRTIRRNWFRLNITYKTSLYKICKKKQCNYWHWHFCFIKGNMKDRFKLKAGAVVFGLVMWHLTLSVLMRQLDDISRVLCVTAHIWWFFISSSFFFLISYAHLLLN